jgi:carboxymethylenebutenolidase
MAIRAVTLLGESHSPEAYLALPEGGPGRHPAVIVIHEIFGPDAPLREVARRFAKKGYAALAPNLFTGELQSLLTPQAVAAGFVFLRSLSPEIQRDPAQIQARVAECPPEEQKLLAALMQIRDLRKQQEFARDLVSVTHHLRKQDYVTKGRVGSVGFCFGGGMSALLACSDPDLAAGLIFYGNTPSPDRNRKIRRPILGLYGGEDHRITDTVPSFAEEAKRAGVRFDYHIYPGAQHAFFNDTRPQVYNADAATDAWRRMIEFYGRELHS